MTFGHTADEHWAKLKWAQHWAALASRPKTKGKALPLLAGCQKGSVNNRLTSKGFRGYLGGPVGNPGKHCQNSSIFKDHQHYG